MQKTTGAISPAILAAVRGCDQAKTQQQFLEGMSRGAEALHQALFRSESRQTGVRQLEAAFTSRELPARTKKLVELCAWPIFDKPALPLQLPEVPEFLWMYCIPVVIQFPEACLKDSVFFEGDVFDVKSLMEALTQADVLNDKAILGCLPDLVSREDLQRYTPADLACSFIQAEMGLGDLDIDNRGIVFDPEIESARVTTLYIVGAARLPVGEKQLLRNVAQWPSAAVSRLVLAGLAEQGIEAEFVKSYPLCSMAETMLTCTSSGFGQLSQTLTLANTHYGLESVSLMFPSDGWAEIHGQVKGLAEDVLLMPPFTFLEPPQSVEDWVKQGCDRLSIEFKGTFCSAAPTSSMLH